MHAANTASITIEIEGVPHLATRKNKGSTNRWDRSKAVRGAREHAWALWREQELPPEPFPKASISITQYYCGRPLDFDGLASGAAPYVDGAIDAGLIEDDEPNKNIVSYSLSHVRVPHLDERRVTVTITEA